MENTPSSNKGPSPKRRQQNKIRMFKEAYLPAIIAGAALLCIIIFIIGSITLQAQKKKADKQASIASSIAQAEEDARIEQHAQELLSEAAAAAAGYDYDTAIAVLSNFKGDFEKYPQIQKTIDEYNSAQEKLIPWNDPGQVVNLSVQLLIADPLRAFNHDVYKNAFNRNFITTEEFSTALQQLYDNGYVLVDLDDIVSCAETESGDTLYTAKTLYLPAGKKPLMLTQTNVNYNIYLVDGDGDKLPDKYGCGFASRLLVDENGEFTCEMVNANGETVTGPYDLVPILEEFIKTHPDFSYQGARAILALTGYNGVFGYRTQESARDTFGEDAYYTAISDAEALANALKEKGYKLACYTYENIAYGEKGAAEIQSDLNDWNNEVVPVIGETDILVYAQMSDISTEKVYSGDKYNLLQGNGFRYYLGFSNDGMPWFNASETCVRQGRIMLTGYNLAKNSAWFTGLLDTAQVLDQTRPAF